MNRNTLKQIKFGCYPVSWPILSKYENHRTLRCKVRANLLFRQEISEMVKKSALVNLPIAVQNDMHTCKTSLWLFERSKSKEIVLIEAWNAVFLFVFSLYQRIVARVFASKTSQVIKDVKEYNCITQLYLHIFNINKSILLLCIQAYINDK